MKRSSILLIALLSSLILAGSAQAHVFLSYPKGGETFAAGEIIEIKWQVWENHSEHTDWDLFFSSDGGTNWEIIQLDIPKAPETYNRHFNWTVPEIVTEQALIRILMDGTEEPYDSIRGVFTIDITTSVLALEEDPKNFTLYSNYPNPFNPATTIEFSLPKAGFVTLVVYDITGQKISELVSGDKMAGVHSVVWNGNDDTGNEVSSGIYFYRLQAGEVTKTQAMTLVR